jgi:hypothetical protein
VKRTLWSLLVSATAAVFPAVQGVRPPALAPQAATAAAQEPARLSEAPQTEIVCAAHELDDAPAASSSFVAASSAVAAWESAPAEISAPPASPDAVPLSRRSLGKPRVRAPDVLV